LKLLAAVAPQHENKLSIRKLPDPSLTKLDDIRGKFSLRRIPTDDCFDRTSLEDKLRDGRAAMVAANQIDRECCRGGRRRSSSPPPLRQWLRLQVTGDPDGNLRHVPPRGLSLPQQGGHTGGVVEQGAGGSNINVDSNFAATQYQTGEAAAAA